jgi:hypothetical protein
MDCDSEQQYVDEIGVNNVPAVLYFRAAQLVATMSREIARCGRKHPQTQRREIALRNGLQRACKPSEAARALKLMTSEADRGWWLSSFPRSCLASLRRTDETR